MMMNDDYRDYILLFYIREHTGHGSWILRGIFYYSTAR
jgi:hypothetical protein